MESNEKEFEIIVHSKKKIINNYYTFIKKLSPYFFQSIVEKENEINLGKNSNENTIHELGVLYKKAIEYYSGLSKEKVKFFLSKLSSLLILQTSKKKKQNKNDETKWSQYIKRHKETILQVNMYIKSENLKYEIKDMINNYYQRDKESEKICNFELQKQEEQFKEKKFCRKKQIRRSSSIHVGKVAKMISQMIEDFEKKFYYSFLRSALFEKSVECTNETLSEIYYHKIRKYYFYQEQIKQFQLLLNDEGNEGQHQEGIHFLLDDLEKERDNYFKKLEQDGQKAQDLITKKCISTSIENEPDIIKYRTQLINSITDNYFK